MIAVIDVSGNNLASLGNALKQIGATYEMTHCPETIKRASHIILPGVGTARRGMQALRDYQLVTVLQQCPQPILGICLGMQLLLESSEEGDVDCLGLIPGKAGRLLVEENCPVPHMGWNRLHWQIDTAISQGLDANSYVYFVHSYALKSREFALATCEYSESFTAIVQHENVYGMQFHPEKSAEVGLQLLKNFINC